MRDGARQRTRAEDSFQASVPAYGMSWVNIVWAMMAAACLTLGLIHLSVWLKQRTQHAHLLFASAAVAVAAVAAAELLMMRAETVEQFATLQRWHHVPLFVLIVSIVGFVRVYLGSGRMWLAWIVCGLRVLVLVVNFLADVSVNYSEIAGLRQLEIWGGENVTVADGVVNPWTRLGAISLVLFLLYVADASVASWRRGDREARRRSLVVGGSIVFAILVAGTHATLVHDGVIRSPYLVTPTFLAVLIAMGYELGSDVFRAAQLARQVRVSEAQARESEERLKVALKGARLAFWDWDIANGKVYLSDRWQQMLGGPAQPTVTTLQQLAPLVHPDDLEMVDRRLREVLRGTVAEFDVDHRVRTLSGEWVWIHSQGEVVARNGNGRALRMAGIYEDITARKQYEERFRLVVEASPNALVMTDRAGTITLVNAQTEKMFGYSREELMGRTVEVLIPERFRTTHPGFPELWAADQKGRPMGMGRDLFCRRKDGSEVLVEVGTNPIHASDGFFFLTSIIDLTERRRMELETAEQRNELAHLSRVAMLGELSGSLAHELNQPLAAILSNAQAAQRFLAQDAGDLHEVRAILKDIVEDDKRAGEVIRRLRALLKKEDIQYSPLDINEVALDALRLMRSDLLNRNVTVSTELTPELPPISGDRVQLQQVLLNLVVNACDAMEDAPPRERRLTIRTALVNGGNIEVAIADQGRGLSEEDLERVFEPFITTKAQGMGLGLAVCRTIVEAHHGRIWATSNADRGATFRVKLPATGGAHELH